TGPPIVTTKTTALELTRLFLLAGVNPITQLNMHLSSRGGYVRRFADQFITTGATPMLPSSASQDVETVRLLLEYKGRVDVPNVMGVTPLIAAAGWGMRAASPRFDPMAKDAQDRSIATLELLWAAGAGVNARVSVTDRTARMGRGGTLPERGGQSA